MTVWQTTVSLIGSLAALALALGVLWRTPPVKWVRHAVGRSVAEAHLQLTQQALTGVLSNGNPISDKLDSLGRVIDDHVKADLASFATIEARAKGRDTAAAVVAERTETAVTAVADDLAAAHDRADATEGGQGDAADASARTDADPA